MAKRKRRRSHVSHKFPRIGGALRLAKNLPTIEEWDYLLMKEAYTRYRNKTQAAAALGLTREGFRKKLDGLGLG
jgi:hypothetical protein